MIAGDNTRRVLAGQLDFPGSSGVGTAHVPAGSIATKASMLFDGLGSSNGSITFTVAVKDSGGATILTTGPATIEDGAAATWLDFEFDAVDLATLTALTTGNYTLAATVVAGNAASARAWVFPAGGESPDSDDPVLAFLTVFEPFAPVAGQNDFYAARLPFSEAQALLGAKGAKLAGAQFCTVGWHGTGRDPEQGSFAIVKIGGQLESLLGKVVRISMPGVGRKPVYAFVHSEADIVQDITVTRRLFHELGTLGEGQTAAVVAEAGGVAA